MTRKQTITDILTKTLNPSYLDVLDESHMHSGPNAETHFKVVVVSDLFHNQMLLNRHRLVNDALKQVFEGGLHALSIISYTPQEWQAQNQQVPVSPPCMGGSKHEH